MTEQERQERIEQQNNQIEQKRQELVRLGTTLGLDEANAPKLGWCIIRENLDVYFFSMYGPGGLEAHEEATLREELRTRCTEVIGSCFFGDLEFFPHSPAPDGSERIALSRTLVQELQNGNIVIPTNDIFKKYYDIMNSQRDFLHNLEDKMAQLSGYPFWHATNDQQIKYKTKTSNEEVTEKGLIILQASLPIDRSSAKTEQRFIAESDLRALIKETTDTLMSFQSDQFRFIHIYQPPKNGMIEDYEESYLFFFSKDAQERDLKNTFSALENSGLAPKLQEKFREIILGASPLGISDALQFPSERRRIPYDKHLLDKERTYLLHKSRELKGEYNEQYFTIRDLLEDKDAPADIKEFLYKCFPVLSSSTPGNNPAPEEKTGNEIEPLSTFEM